jgi:subtilisin family serine protease
MFKITKVWRFVVTLSIAGTCVVLPTSMTTTVTAATNPIPVSQNVSRAKYVLVAHSESDFVSLRSDLQNTGAKILKEYSSVFSGAAVLISPEQAQALQNDPRVSAIELNQMISIDESSLDNSDVIPGAYIIELMPRASAVAQEEVLEILGDNVMYQYTQAILGFAARLTPSEVKLLQTNPNVKSVEPDRVVRVEGEQLSPPWGLDRLDQQSLPLNSRYSYQGSGSGVTVYVVDSGINSTLSEFGGRVRLGWPSTGAQDCHGHGTHVAGTVGSSTYGVAKSVSLVSVRVLSCEGYGANSTIIAGLDWIKSDHVAGVKAVANLSLGGAYSDQVNSAVNQVINDGIVVAVAAGNESVSACSKSPASTPAAITVAASDSSDNRASFSNYGSCVDIFAPGVSIRSTLISGGNGTKDGTSMASPHVAGAAAVIWSVNPNYASTQVTSALISGATSNKVYDAMGSPNRLLFLAPSSGIAPSTPSNVVGSFASGAVTIGWAAPTSSGTNAITSYQVVTSGGISVCSWSYGPLQCQSTSLSAGTYSFKVSASSSAGTSPYSPLSNSVVVSTSGNNDYFSSARLISGTSGSVNDTNTSATRETGEPITRGSTASTKWYSYTPASSGTLTVNTNGSSYDTVLGVFTGSSVSSLSNVASDDDSGDGYNSLVSLSVSSGTTYFVQVGAYSSGAIGAITLNWSLGLTSCYGSPVNDNLSCATVLNGSSGLIGVSNTSATLEISEPVHNFSVCKSVWFKVAPAGMGTATFDTDGSTFDTVMTLYRSTSSNGSYGSLNFVAENNDYSANDPTSYLSNQSVSNGYTYFIRIAGYSSNYGCNYGTITLGWSINVSSPVVVPGPPTNVAATGDINSATVSWNAPSSNGGSTITSYTATSSPGGYTCTTSSLSCVVAGLNNYVPYTFTVTARNSAGSSLSSVASTSVILGYQNDNLSGAMGIADGTTYSNNSAATVEIGEPVHADGAGEKSMWFRYSSPTTKLVTLNTNGSEFDTVLAVYGASVSVAPAGSMNATVQEGTTLSMSAQNGMAFTSVEFASFGTPIESGSYFSVGSCHAPTSKNLIANTFVGRSSGSVSATSSTFGDPCPGTFKSLSVRLNYSSNSSVSFSGLQVVGANDDHPSGLNGSSAVSFVANPNVVYYIAVAGYGTASGAFVLKAAAETILVPSSPTSVKAAALNGGASVSWRKPATSFSTITNYRVTSNPGGRTCDVVPSVFSCSISGLTNGTPYTFRVIATNPAGNSVSSTSSNVVVPASSGVTRRIAPVWGIDRIDQRTSSDDGYLSSPGRGKGTRIYVVDTGVRRTHSEFGLRVSVGFSTVPDGRGTDDCNGHGTHVASTAAGNFYGVANLATIVPVRVLACDGYGDIEYIVDGLDWVHSQILNTNSQAVVNMSLGGGYSSSIEIAVEKIIQLGVPVVAAAGNSSTNACYSSPAGVQKAITVGASTSTNGQAAYSNYGSCVDVFAPGSSIMAAGISGETSTSVKSGTSMAAPHAAGYAAVVKGLFPKASAAAVQKAITNSASSNVLTNVSVGTANRLLYVALPKCEVAVRAGIPCSSFVLTANTPATFAKIAQIANLYVSASAKVTVSVLSSHLQNCRVVDRKIVAVKTGTCGVVVTVATSSQTRTSRVFIAVKK